MALLPVIPGQLPSGFCATDYQSILNEFSAHQSVNVGGDSGVTLVASATKPTDQDVAWLRLDQFGRPERIYFFASGGWLSRHPLVPGATLWWFDVVPTFTTYDGGDALAQSVISGPMWQLAKRPNGTVIAAQFPIAAGTLASGTVLAVGDIGGEETHLLTVPEMPAHSHVYTEIRGESYTGGPVSSTCNGSGNVGATNFPKATSDTGGGLAHNNMPPFVVGYLLQRTVKEFYVIT